MSVIEPAVVIVSFAIALVGTRVVIRFARMRRLLDVPNARSSHDVPTPRGGGLAIVTGATVAAVALAGRSDFAWAAQVQWIVGALVVAAVGFADDLRGLPASVRLAAHATAAALLLFSVGLPSIPWPGGAIESGVLLALVAWLAVMWSINLFNFMDGTDGIAATQAAFVFGAAAGFGAGFATAWLSAAFAAAAAGFLVWNWPRARVFMGDVGSGFLGYLVAAAALLAGGTGGPSIWTWIILSGAFVADATTTLVVRAARGERVHVAHRSHAYQRLARRWQSHLKVLLAYAGVNVGWLLPWAFASDRNPEAGAWMAVIALAPLFLAAVVLGAGKADSAST